MNSSVQTGCPLDLRTATLLHNAEKTERQQMLERLLSELDAIVYRCLNDERQAMC